MLFKNLIFTGILLLNFTAPVMAEIFPNDGLMQENTVYEKSATYENTGVWGGNVFASAEYEKLKFQIEPGKYLPANSEELVDCPAGSYCSGNTEGVYVSNVDQGISTCPENLVSPAGAKSAGDCGKIIHIGENFMYLTSVKQTSPAFAVRLGDSVYYANMAPVADGKKSMNINTNASLHARYDGEEYIIYDNTVVSE